MIVVLVLVALGARRCSFVIVVVVSPAECCFSSISVMLYTSSIVVRCLVVLGLIVVS